jgi:hypothetical protein
MNASTQTARLAEQLRGWWRRFSGRDGQSLEAELRSYDLLLTTGSVVVIGTWVVMTALGRFPLVAHVFSALWVSLQLFVRWRRRHPLHRPRSSEEM